MPGSSAKVVADDPEETEDACGRLSAALRKGQAARQRALFKDDRISVFVRGMAASIGLGTNMVLSVLLGVLAHLLNAGASHRAAAGHAPT